LEAAQKHLDHSREQLTETETRITELTASRDEKAATLNEELSAATDERARAVEHLPEDLMALYERIREKQGIGAAALRARRCGGCQLTLNASDLSVIAKAPADEVVRCEECSRILVRTPESG